MDLLVEVEAKKDAEEIYFEDAYLDDLFTDMGGLIRKVLEKGKEADTVVVYLSQGDELINLWELGVSPDTCAEKLLETFQKIKVYAKKVK